MSNERSRWGAWEYDPDLLTLTHTGNGYTVELTACRTCSEMLDWVCHIVGQARSKSAKDWSAKDLANLLFAFEDLLDPKWHLCLFGWERGKIDLLFVLKQTQRWRM